MGTADRGPSAVLSQKKFSVWCLARSGLLTRRTLHPARTDLAKMRRGRSKEKRETREKGVSKNFLDGVRAVGRRGLYLCILTKVFLTCYPGRERRACFKP